MKTSEQIKGAIRNISKKTGVNPNSLLQMCLFEGVLEKLSKSKYSKNFILKGGLLISSLIGIDMRSTNDCPYIFYSVKYLSFLYILSFLFSKKSH